MLLSGKYVWTNNNDPLWKKTEKLKEDVLADLYANPLRPSGTGQGTFANAEFVEANAFTTQKAPDCNGRKGIFPFIKLELPVTENSSLTLGNYSVFEEKDVFDFDNSIFNAENNPVRTRRNFVTYLKWNQRFSPNENLTVNYNVLVQYSNHFMKTEDRQLGNNFFDYGYIGKFTSYKTPLYELGSIVVDGNYYENIWILNSWDYDTLVTYTPMGNNPGVSNYTLNYYDIYREYPEGHYQNLDQIQLGGGLVNGNSPRMVYSLWNNTATNAGYYARENFEKFRAAFQMKMDYKSQHFNFGGEYNSESRSHYKIAPTLLWALMRGLTNFHIRELDKDNPVPVEHNGVVDTVIFHRRNDVVSQQYFDKNLRKALGLSVDGTDFILIDSYDPENNTILYYDDDGVMHTIKTPDNLFSLDMFSAEELLNDGYSFISYAGYDYTGKRQRGKTDPYSFYDDFSIGASKPAYWSVFLEDEFRWKKLHIRLGLRLDGYNARQPVMKDYYSLFPVFNVSEAMEHDYPVFTKPDNIGDDYLVYVNKTVDPTFITGFRSGDQWYLADGREIDDPEILDVGSGVTPYLKYPRMARVGGDDWTSDMTFSDYKTVVNVLPQITIDYSVTGRINFYVSYSSFSQNPSYYSNFRPEVFYYWESYTRQGIVPNPGLKPMKTGKLFAGMEGLIWRNLVADVSYLMISIKDYIQPKIIRGAYPNDYITMVNAYKFSTGGLLLRLDFVNPGVSGPFGGISFTKMFPDEEDPNYFQVSDAVLNTYLGYHFALDKNNHYPSGFARVMRGFSIGVYYQYRRGTPYYYENHNHVKVIGYTPAVNLLNLNIQKDFLIGNKAVLNVYLTVENPFNFRNVFEVYSRTGKADDDGFLTNPAFQEYINNQLNPDSFRYLYQLHLYDPAHFDIPGIWRAGVIFRY